MTDILWAQVIIGGSTLAAAFLGYVLAGRNDARRDRRAAERERLSRAEDRHSAAIRDRHQFQLETLLELQDAVQLMARLTGRAMHFDHMQARADKYTQLPESYSEEMNANVVDVNRLRNRILDDDLRAEIERFSGASVEASLSPTAYQRATAEEVEDRALRLFTTFGASVSTVMDKLGTALRKELAWTPDEISTSR